MKKIRLDLKNIWNNSSLMLQTYAFKLLLKHNYIENTDKWGSTSLSQVLFDLGGNPCLSNFHHIGDIKRNKYYLIHLFMNKDKNIVKKTLKKAKINLDTWKNIELPTEDFENINNNHIINQLSFLKGRKLNKNIKNKDKIFINNEYAFSNTYNDTYIADVSFEINERGNIALVIYLVFEKAKDSLTKEIIYVKNFNSITDAINTTKEWILKNSFEIEKDRTTLFDRLIK